MVKMRKWKNLTSCYHFVQFVEDFRFWVNAAGRAHRLFEKEISKMFVTGIKPDLFREEINSISCATLQEAMDESRAKLSTDRHFGDH